jgi:hypothetical protein
MYTDNPVTTEIETAIKILKLKDGKLLEYGAHLMKSKDWDGANALRPESDELTQIIAAGERFLDLMKKRIEKYGFSEEKWTRFKSADVTEDVKPPIAERIPCGPVPGVVPPILNQQKPVAEETKPVAKEVAPPVTDLPDVIVTDTGKTIASHRRRPTREMRVSVNGGHIIFKKHASLTFVEAINQMGIDKVFDLAIERSGVPLIDVKERKFYPKQSVGMYKKSGDFYINTQMNNPSKKRVLEEIAERLGIKIEVEVDMHPEDPRDYSALLNESSVQAPTVPSSDEITYIDDDQIHPATLAPRQGSIYPTIPEGTVARPAYGAELPQGTLSLL